LKIFLIHSFFTTYCTY